MPWTDISDSLGMDEMDRSCTMEPWLKPLAVGIYRESSCQGFFGEAEFRPSTVGRFA